MMDFLQPLKIASLMCQDADMFLPVLSKKLQGISGLAAELSWNGIELNTNAGLGPATRQRLRQIRSDI